MSDGISGNRVARVLPIAGLTARSAGGRIVAGLRQRTGSSCAVEDFHQRTAERYADLLGHSKGVLMKVGQMLSMIDLGAVGDGRLTPYVDALARLHTDVPPMDMSLVERTVRTELGRPLGEVFAQFEEEPMAAASIGQVHRAVLHDGRVVAVKVQYPGAGSAIQADLANAELLATVLRLMASAAGAPTIPNLREAAREMSSRIREELDYRHEATTIRAFSRLYRGHPFIRVPELIPHASGDRVLTMTFMNGIGWSEAQHSGHEMRSVWAEVIMRFLLGSYRHANLLHADPHAGNYRFGLDGTVGFVDFGCVKVLPEPQRRRVVMLARAVLDRRKRDAFDVMTESGFVTDDRSVGVEEAYRWWEDVLHESLAEEPVTFGPHSSRRVIQTLMDLRSSRHPVWRMSIPEDYVFFARVLFGIMGLNSQLGATVDARSITDDLDGITGPVTTLGRRHHEWVSLRELPFGLDHHLPA